MKRKFQIPPAACGSAKECFNENGELKKPMLTIKDIATVMLVHVRTVKRWWKKLNVPPFIYGRHGSHRWTYQQAQILLERWRDYSAHSLHVQNWSNGKIGTPKK